MITATFTAEELDLFRQWFNSIEDVNPRFIAQGDRDLYAKVVGLLAPKRHTVSGSDAADDDDM